MRRIFALRITKELIIGLYNWFLLKNEYMKKSLLILGLVASSWLSAGSLSNDKEVKKTAAPAKIERAALKLDFLKVEYLKIQLQDKNHKSLEKSIKLLNELKPIIAKIERDLRQN